MAGLARDRVTRNPWRGRAVVLTLLVAAALPAPAAAATPPNREVNGEPVSVLIRFGAPPGRAARDAITAVGGKVRHQFHVVPTISASVPEKALAGLRRNPLVESIELDGKLVAIDHGPETGDIEYENAWGVEHIGVPAVHAAGIRGAGIQVAVIDTGLDYIHDQPPSLEPPVVDPEFLGNYAGGEDFHSEVPNGPMALDGDPMDDNGHGTHVSGILAAEKNGYLVSGVAPDVDLFALKVLKADGTGEYSNLIAALEWIIDYNAENPGAPAIDVVNMSIGGHDVSTNLANAIAATSAAGVVLVAAAGNINPADIFEILYGCPVVYPAAYPQVLSTTFTNENNALTGYSCTGPEVDFASPGDFIASPVPVGPCMLCNPNGYDFLSGTSMASPHLAGTVALLLDAGLADVGTPGFLDDAKDLLCDTADLGWGVQSGFSSTPIPPNDPRYPKYFGCGVIDADGAVLGLVPPPPTNNPPDAVEDFATTFEEEPVTVEFLENDTDADDDPLVPSLTSQPQHGDATLGVTSVTYTPDPDFSGPDYFTYRVDDGHGGTDDATVYITITPVNDPPDAVDDSATTTEDVAVVVEVLGNDTDVDFDELTPSVATQPSNGTAAVEGFTIRYTPAADYSGSDSFTYTISDGTLADTATVNLTVTAAGDPPTATDDTATTLEDSPVTISVLLNDTDPEGETLTPSVTAQPAHGSAAVQGSAIVYTPAANYNGPDSFTYSASDGSASDGATVSVTVTPVQDPPVANDDTASSAEDTPATIVVLTNDADSDGDSLTPSVTAQPAHGTAAILGSSIRYTPAANYSGPDSFTYAVSDGRGGSDAATVSVTVTAVNDVPTADPKTVAATSGVGQQVILSGSDVETCELTFVLVDLPDFGGIGTASNLACVAGTPNTDTRSVTYTSNAGYGGPDSFSYRVNDGAADSPIVTVSITVSALPVTPTVHVGDLDASRTQQAKSWTAIVTVRVDNGVHGAVSGATVNGTWSTGATGAGSCVTAAGGTCNVSKANIAKKTNAVTFTVTGITHAGSTYQPSANHDPDGSSNGTAIVVTRV